MQWRYAGPKPMGETKPDGDIIVELFEKIREMYAKEGGALPEPIKALNWEAVSEKGAFAPHKTAKLINGYFLKDVTIKDKTYAKGSLVPSFAFLQDDGSTTSGNWLYCGSFTEAGNMMKRRGLAALV